MKQSIIVLLALLAVAAVRPPEPGQTVYVYETTYKQLDADIQYARKWGTLFELSGDAVGAAYFAGITAHALAQYQEPHGDTNTPLPGQALDVYATTDIQLLEDIQAARRWWDFFTISGDVVGIAYFAGMEFHALSQYQVLQDRIDAGRPPSSGSPK